MSTATFSPTVPETALVNQIFNLYDSQKLGVLTGDVAIKAFAGANLPPTVLSEIWNIADEDNKGWLSRRGVSIAIRLIGWAQKGENVSKDLLARPGSLPSIEGITIISQQNSGIPLTKSPPAISLPPLTPQDRTKFHSLFYKANPQNGLISGEKARAIFLKSKLSNDQLLQIWNLADTQDRGALDIKDFTIGMYFIQAVMSRQLSMIPMSLPPGLYQQATGNSQTVGIQISGNRDSLGASSGFQQHKVVPQYTGQNILQANVAGTSPTQKVPPNLSVRSTGSAPLGSSPFALPVASAQWDISPVEKAKADQFFQELDINKRGYIEGDVAVPFMLNSKLPGEDLARVWDLSDLDNNGRLTSDGFAIAVHLIQKRLSGQELPIVLPPTLIPPSIRNDFAANATSFPPISQHHAPEPVHDLFTFDDPAPTSGPQTTEAASILQPQQTDQTLTTFPLSTASSRNGLVDPFSLPSSAQSQDLLGDDDDDGKAASPLQDRSAEIGNAQNQLNSTTKSLQTAKDERISVEQLLSDQATQLVALQTQLSAAKTAYDTETKLLVNLKERRANQLDEIQKLREELIHVESNLSAVRVEKAEIEGAFLRDKEVAREIHRKMAQIGQEAEKLRQELEKAKKEAKQQKGLLAIARKQLSTKEGAKSKIERELSEVTDEISSIIVDKERSEAELVKAATTPPVAASPELELPPNSATYAAQYPLPSTPEMLEGAGRSNNPFERFDIATNSKGTAQTAAMPVSFESAFNMDESAGNDNPLESHTNTPKPHHKSPDLATSSPPEDVLSPTLESELFVTPPSSSFARSGTSSPDQQGATAVDANSFEATVAQYPAVENLGTQFPESFPKVRAEVETQGHLGTDFNVDLKEFEVDEPDSDTEEEEGPLADSTKENGKAKESDDKNLEPSKTMFDDIFGVTAPIESEPVDGVPKPKVDPDVHSIMNETKMSSFELSAVGQAMSPVTAQTTSNSTGISAFDEALGKLPSRTEVEASNSVVNGNNQLTFDTAFDDNFDFVSAKTSTSVVPLNSDVDEPTTVPLAERDGPKFREQGVSKSLSFDEAFTGLDPQPFVGIAGLSPIQASTQPGAQPDTESTTQTLPSSVPSTPQYKLSPRPSNGSPETSFRSSSPTPQRARSPKRVSSPKPRPSASSGKDEKQGSIPTRHSKLSLRLPFVGKRKKQQELQSAPAPAQLPSPPREHHGSVIVSDDDAQPVKQLISMGFSRTEAIDALERNAYDVQRALNSLLGAP